MPKSDIDVHTVRIMRAILQSTSKLSVNNIVRETNCSKHLVQNIIFKLVEFGWLKKTRQGYEFKEGGFESCQRLQEEKAKQVLGQRYVRPGAPPVYKGLLTRDAVWIADILEMKANDRQLYNADIKRRLGLTGAKVEQLLTMLLKLSYIYLFKRDGSIVFYQFTPEGEKICQELVDEMTVIFK